MASITIRNLPDEDKQRLRERAAKNGRSMEAEVRTMIHNALRVEANTDNSSNTAQEGSEIHFVDQIRARFADIGGFDLPEVEREPMREPPKFE